MSTPTIHRPLSAVRPKPSAETVQTVESIRTMQAWADEKRREGSSIGLVPTMGALHEGHLSLVRLAYERADRIVTSIFVNPIQFDAASDFGHYPRDAARDVTLLEEHGVDVLFMPDPAEMYPEGSETRVEAPEVSRPLCGAYRPGHFTGVNTVVSKLFLAAKPHFAVFGEKDFQQLQVVRRMTRDLNFDVEIVPGPIVREEDGLAMSSRNRRLDPVWRKEAAAIPRGLQAVKQLTASGERSATALVDSFREVIATTRLRIEYADVRDSQTLRLVDGRVGEGSTLAVAAWAGDVRLIDNLRL